MNCVVFWSRGVGLVKKMGVLLVHCGEGFCMHHSCRFGDMLNLYGFFPSHAFILLLAC